LSEQTENDILVSYTPANFPFYEHEGAIVVIVDILRATSAMCTAFMHGVKKIIPVPTIEEAKVYQDKGFLVGAERNGEKVESFEMGNSPYDYMGENIKDSTVVITTTNGTRAIEAAKGSYKVVIGSFLNITALVTWLIEEDRSVILLCSGWKNKYNMEDSIFAGAVVGELLKSDNYSTTCDAAIASSHMFGIANYDVYRFLEYSSHRIRLRKLQLEDDIRYCLKRDQTDVIPILEGDAIVKMEIKEKV